MRKFSFLISLIAFFLVLSCNNEKSKISTTPSVSDDKNGFYKHFKGVVDNLPITMDLVYSKNSLNNLSPYLYSGSYYYDKYQIPITLYGENDSLGNTILYEYDVEGEEIVFKGKLDLNGSFLGTWSDIPNKKTLSFNLKESYKDGALKFDILGFNDSVKLWKDNPNSPMATIETQAFLPAQNTEGGISGFLKDKIFRTIKGDTLDVSYKNISFENLCKIQRDTFFKGYLNDMTSEAIDTSEGISLMLNFAASSKMTVLHNSKDLLSIGFSEYYYSGGAHGNHTTMLKSFDLKNKKTLTLNDIFKPNFDKKLNLALTNAAYKYFKLEKNKSLTEVLFENNIVHNDNFAITPKGIIFQYNPYEIAAFAMGEIQLFVPFDAIKDIVKEL